MLMTWNGHRYAPRGDNLEIANNNALEVLNATKREGAEKGNKDAIKMISEFVERVQREYKRELNSNPALSAQYSLIEG